MIDRVIHIPSLGCATGLFFCTAGLFASGCDAPEKKQDDQVAQAPSAVSAPPQEKKPQVPLRTAQKGHPQPEGPAVVFSPGKGAGAIFFGAKFETVERHMEAPCDIRTETRCGYVRRAIEFEMKDGVVAKIKAHRRGRKVPGAQSEKEGYYGTFRGSVQPRIMLGLHRHVVVAEFGEPRARTPLAGEDGQVERHEYDGIAYEYDKLENGNTVLSAIEVIPSETAQLGPQKTSQKKEGLKK